jgi:hypothetical protein
MKTPIVIPPVMTTTNEKASTASIFLTTPVGFGCCHLPASSPVADDISGWIVAGGVNGRKKANAGGEKSKYNWTR